MRAPPFATGWATPLALLVCGCLQIDPLQTPPEVAAETGAESEAGPDTVAGPDPDPEAAAETEAETETAPETEAGPAPAAWFWSDAWYTITESDLPTQDQQANLATACGTWSLDDASLSFAGVETSPGAPSLPESALFGFPAGGDAVISAPELAYSRTGTVSRDGTLVALTHDVTDDFGLLVAGAAADLDASALTGRWRVTSADQAGDTALTRVADIELFAVGGQTLTSNTPRLRSYRDIDFSLSVGVSEGLLAGEITFDSQPTSVRGAVLAGGQLIVLCAAGPPPAQILLVRTGRVAQAAFEGTFTSHGVITSTSHMWDLRYDLTQTSDFRVSGSADGKTTSSPELWLFPFDFLPTSVWGAAPDGGFVLQLQTEVQPHDGSDIVHVGHGALGAGDQIELAVGVYLGGLFNGTSPPFAADEDPTYVGMRLYLRR